MKRLKLAFLPSDGRSGLALSPSVPLVMQGENRVSSYAPSALPEASAGMMDRVAHFYESDPQLGGLLAEALATRETAGDIRMRSLRNAEKSGALAASLMRDPDGAAMIFGGNIAGGRVLGEWPGLAERDLFENHDPRPAGSLEAVLSGAIGEHFGIDPATAMATLFPGREMRAITGFTNG